ncbi:MAG: polysaccharide deacetylase family protein, partial [bacterium]
IVDGSNAEEISFADAMSRAGNAGCEDLRFAPQEMNPTFSYFYDNEEHEVWFLDAASFANHWNSARDFGFAGVMLNRIGMEDSSVWKVMAKDGQTTASDFAESIPSGDSITSIGRGEVVSLDPSKSEGRRNFSNDPEGRIFSNYLTPPACPTLFRMNAATPDRITITFDDGPDPEWTPQILDILKERGIKAVFFIVGQEAELYPDLVRRIVAEGHEIGNHSFTHPNLAEEPASIIRLELNATQRLIESLTGLSTTLFRPPYNADSHPSKLEELVPIGVAQSLGYMTVLENIDPRDWQDIDKEEILARVKKDRPKGSIILLHDGGGDRNATVEALPALLDYLQERGDQVVSLSELLGLDPHKIMPPVTLEKKTFHLFTSGIGFQILRIFQSFLHWFIVISTTLVVARTILIIILARLHKAPPPSSLGYHPSVSVIIPAYNEQKVIAKTIQSLLASEYQGTLDVVVIDDGSTDGTVEAVESVNDSRLRVVRQSNSGKAYALQRGVDVTKNEILIFADADTQFDRHAIALLAGTFENSEIGAVSGHARVGNRSTFLARCQDLEYICGFNLDRRAYATWNCITVAPGAISAIRRTTIIEAGGFSYETLAEDTDLTLAIHKTGSRVEYQPLAIAYTEAPETFSALASQRFRWAYGTLQCVFKHADILFNPHYKALGFLSLPGILFFQIVLVAFSPAIDVLFIESMIMGRVGAILPYFLAFLLCDVLVAAAALQMEGLPLRHALRIIPQRFLYRPLLSYVVWKSLIHALKGAWVGWGKLQRTATVSIP